MTTTGTQTTLSTTTYGRKVHLALGTRTVCSDIHNSHPVADVLAVLSDDGGQEALLDALAGLRIAPSRICGNCFYVKTRVAYARKVAA